MIKFLATYAAIITAGYGLKFGAAAVVTTIGVANFVTVIALGVVTILVLANQN